MGRLYGAEERVLERVVTYLCLSDGAWNMIYIISRCDTETFSV